MHGARSRARPGIQTGPKECLGKPGLQLDSMSWGPGGHNVQGREAGTGTVVTGVGCRVRCWRDTTEPHPEVSHPDMASLCHVTPQEASGRSQRHRHMWSHCCALGCPRHALCASEEGAGDCRCLGLCLPCPQAQRQQDSTHVCWRTCFGVISSLRATPSLSPVGAPSSCWPAHTLPRRHTAPSLGLLSASHSAPLCPRVPRPHLVHMQERAQWS